MNEDTNSTANDTQQSGSTLDNARERLSDVGTGARDRLSDAGSAIRDRVDGLVDAAKQNPAAAAAIAAGAAAAVGAAAYGVTKLREGNDNGASSNKTGGKTGGKK